MLLKTAKKIIIAVVGGTVLLIGVIFIVTPGPAMVVIPVGLAILGTEFVWARQLLKRVKERSKAVAASMGLCRTEPAAGELAQKPAPVPLSAAEPADPHSTKTQRTYSPSKPSAI